MADFNSDQYIPDMDSRYPIFSDVQTHDYNLQGMISAQNSAMYDNENNYNIRSMIPLNARRVRRPEDKFMAAQMGVPAYVLNYQCDKGRIINERTYGPDMVPDYKNNWPQDRKHEYKPISSYEHRPQSIDSHSPIAGRLPSVDTEYANIKYAPRYQRESFTNDIISCDNGAITIKLDINMILLFIFIVVMSLCHLFNQIAVLRAKVGAYATNLAADTTNTE